MAGNAFSALLHVPRPAIILSILSVGAHRFFNIFWAAFILSISIVGAHRFLNIVWSAFILSIFGVLISKFVSVGIYSVHFDC